MNNNNIDNKLIRRTMNRYVKKFGPQDTREMITKFAQGFKTKKQRISGNISCMACIDGTVSIKRNKPHSIMY